MIHAKLLLFGPINNAACGSNMAANDDLAYRPKYIIGKSPGNHFHFTDTKLLYFDAKTALTLLLAHA
jgi:hypothetical protein